MGPPVPGHGLTKQAAKTRQQMSRFDAAVKRVHDTLIAAGAGAGGGGSVCEPYILILDTEGTGPAIHQVAILKLKVGAALRTAYVFLVCALSRVCCAVAFVRCLHCFALTSFRRTGNTC